MVIGLGGDSQSGPEAVIISTLLYQALAKHAPLGNQASVTVDVKPRKTTRKERKEKARQREHQFHVARKKQTSFRNSQGLGPTSVLRGVTSPHGELQTR